MMLSDLSILLGKTVYSIVAQDENTVLITADHTYNIYVLQNDKVCASESDYIFEFRKGVQITQINYHSCDTAVQVFITLSGSGLRETEAAIVWFHKRTGDIELVVQKI